MTIASRSEIYAESGIDIDQRATISTDAVISRGCVIAGGAVIGAGVTLGIDVVIGPNVVFIDATQEKNGALTNVGASVEIGANSVIYPGVHLAGGCLIRPGSVVTRSVPPGAIVEGNPANIVGYVNAEQGGTQSRIEGRILFSEGVESTKTQVRGVSLHNLPVISDLRGSLTVGEFAQQIPFLPLRYFMVFGVPSREIRGEHAHRVCDQYLICARGSCSVVADDGVRRVEILLDGPQKGLYLPAMTWGVQYKHSADALLIVFASHHYDASDYIRNYSDFLDLVGK